MAICFTAFNFIEVDHIHKKLAQIKVIS